MAAKQAGTGGHWQHKVAEGTATPAWVVHSLLDLSFSRLLSRFRPFIRVCRPSFVSLSCFIMLPSFIRDLWFLPQPLSLLSAISIHVYKRTEGVEKGQPALQQPSDLAAGRKEACSPTLYSASQLCVALGKLQRELLDRESQHTPVRATGGQATRFLCKNHAHHVCSHHEEADNTPRESSAHCWLCLFCFTAFTTKLHQVSETAIPLHWQQNPGTCYLSKFCCRWLPQILYAWCCSGLWTLCQLDLWNN